MRINVIIMGKNDLGVGCAEILTADPDINILGIVGHEGDSDQDGWQKSLIKFAVDRDIRYVTPKKIDRETLVDLAGGAELDYLFSFQYEKIIKPPVLSYPSLGCINTHFSLLPRNRGMYTIAWALIEGDEETGVTIHYMDEGIDTGDIIGERSFRIRDEYNAQDIYEKCNIEGIKLLRDLLPALKTKEYLGKPQDNRKATYHSKDSLDFENTGVNWNGNGRKVFNRIRQMIFPVYQFPTVSLNGNTLQPSKVRLLEIFADGIEPGEFIMAVDEKGLKVASADKLILIEKFHENGSDVDARTLWNRRGYPDKGRFE